MRTKADADAKMRAYFLKKAARVLIFYYIKGGRTEVRPPLCAEPIYLLILRF